MLGFEEPETGIHPGQLDLIASLLENLASDGTQVIVTTHSPTLVDLIPAESLYVCRQIHGNTIITPLAHVRAKGGKPSVNNTEETPVSERILRGDFDAIHLLVEWNIQRLLSTLWIWRS